jgi:hypothetical protein
MDFFSRFYLGLLKKVLQTFCYALNGGGIPSIPPPCATPHSYSLISFGNLRCVAHSPSFRKYFGSVTWVYGNRLAHYFLDNYSWKRGNKAHRRKRPKELRHYGCGEANAGIFTIASNLHEKQCRTVFQVTGSKIRFAAGYAVGTKSFAPCLGVCKKTQGLLRQTPPSPHQGLYSM